MKKLKNEKPTKLDANSKTIHEDAKSRARLISDKIGSEIEAIPKEFPSEVDYQVTYIANNIILKCLEVSSHNLYESFGMLEYVKDLLKEKYYNEE